MSEIFTTFPLPAQLCATHVLLFMLQRIDANNGKTLAARNILGFGACMTAAGWQSWHYTELGAKLCGKLRLADTCTTWIIDATAKVVSN